MNLTDEAVSKTNLKQIKNDLPILLISGGNDPVVNYGEDTAELFDTFQRYHFTAVDCTIYDECRHDLLHETNNAEIIKDILEWLNKAMDNRRLRAAAALRAKKKKNKGNTRNRTAAEAARSALGYASDNIDDTLEDSIQADDLGDDSDFLEDMGYFNRGAGNTADSLDEEEEDEDFIIMDDDDDDDLDSLGSDDEVDAPDVQEIKTSAKDKAALRKDAKRAKKEQKEKEKLEKKELKAKKEEDEKPAETPKEEQTSAKKQSNNSGKNSSKQKKKHK